MLILFLSNTLKEVEMVKKQSDIKVNVKNNIPEGVWILSVILFAGALLSVLMALWMFNAADQFGTLAPQLAQYGTSEITPTTFVNLGVLFIVLAFVSYFIGRGLLKLQKRARVVLIIVAALTLALSVFSLVSYKQLYSNTFTIVVNVVIMWYLFRKQTNSAFR